MFKGRPGRLQRQRMVQRMKKEEGAGGEWGIVRKVCPLRK